MMIYKTREYKPKQINKTYGWHKYYFEEKEYYAIITRVKLTTLQ